MLLLRQYRSRLRPYGGAMPTSFDGVCGVCTARMGIKASSLPAVRESRHCHKSDALAGDACNRVICELRSAFTIASVRQMSLDAFRYSGHERAPYACYLVRVYSRQFLWRRLHFNTLCGVAADAQTPVPEEMLPALPLERIFSHVDAGKISFSYTTM